MTCEHARDRAAMAARYRLQTHRPPVRPRAGIEDPLLLDRRELPRTRLRHRPPRQTPAAVATLLLACRSPAVPRGRDRRWRAAHRSRDRARLLAGEKARDHLALGARSEPASTVVHVS